jgi:hypothetical protein
MHVAPRGSDVQRSTIRSAKRVIATSVSALSG